MYFVDVCEAECLDTARALWLTGADYVSLYIRQPYGDAESWVYRPTAFRGAQKGGYSNA